LLGSGAYEHSSRPPLTDFLMESIKLRGRSAASIQLSTGDFYRGFPERSVPADGGAPEAPRSRRGQHPCGCRPRSGACVACSCQRGFRARGRFRPVRALVAVRVAQIRWLSPFCCHLFALEDSRLRRPTCGPAKTPPRAAPSWMPPAVSRLRLILPSHRVFRPGAACRTATRRSRSGLPRFGGCHEWHEVKALVFGLKGLASTRRVVWS